MRRFAAPGLAILDQMIASLTSVAVVVLAARALTVSDFGAFALLFTSAMMCVGVGRAYLVEPQLVMVPASDVHQRWAGLLNAVRAWLVMILVGGGVGLISVALTDGQGLLGVGGALLLLTTAAGLLDSLRMLFVGTGRRLTAVLSSTALVVVTVSLFAAIGPDSLVPTLTSLAGAYVSVGAVLCGVTVYRTHSKVGLRVHEVPTLSPEARRHGRNFSIEFLAGNGGYYLASIATASLVGLRAAAGLRGAEALLGPVRVLIAVLPNALLATTDARFYRRKLAYKVSAVSAAVAALAYAVAMIVLSLMGPSLFGASAGVVGEVLPVLALAPVFMALSTGPAIGLRSLRLSHVTARIRAGTALLPLIGAVGGAAGGVRGVGLGLAAASAVASVAWWAVFIAVTR